MQTVQSLALPRYLRTLLDQVVDRTGHPLHVSEEGGIGYDSELRLARHGRPYHELAYVPAYRDHRLHFLLSAAVKALRVWEVPPDERFVPATQLGRTLPPEDYQDLRRKVPALSLHALDDLSQFLYHGITRQLTSMPVDIRVEREIAERFPAHQAEQRAYLQRQVEDLEPTFAPQIAEVSPERLYRASTAMNVVLAEEAAEITGSRPGPLCQGSPHRTLGAKLRELLHAVDDDGYAGDRVLTDLWADELGMRDFYQWVHLDLIDG